MGVSLDRATLEFSLRRTIERIARFLAGNPEALHLVQNLNSAVALARSLPFQVDLWTAQNVYHEIRATSRRPSSNGPPMAIRRQCPPGPACSGRWAESFSSRRRRGSGSACRTIWRAPAFGPQIRVQLGHSPGSSFSIPRHWRRLMESPVFHLYQLKLNIGFPVWLVSRHCPTPTGDGGLFAALKPAGRHTSDVPDPLHK